MFLVDVVVGDCVGGGACGVAVVVRCVVLISCPLLARVSLRSRIGPVIGTTCVYYVSV